MMQGDMVEADTESDTTEWKLLAHSGVIYTPVLKSVRRSVRAVSYQSRAHEFASGEFHTVGAPVIS